MASKSLADLGTYERIAGNLCLDFVNTMGGGRGTRPKEYLHGYAELAAWGHVAGLVTRAEAEELVRLAERAPAAAAETHARAVALREATYRVVTAPQHGRVPSPEDLFLVAREAAFALGRARLVATDGGFTWSWPPSAELDRVLWPVARSAAELVTSPALARVHECASETCTWVFLDTSKNHRRRWCVMSDCGNLAKVRRFRKR